MHNHRQGALRSDRAKAAWLRFAGSLSLTVAMIGLSVGASTALAQTSTLQTFPLAPANAAITLRPPGLTLSEQLVGTTSAGRKITCTNNSSVDVYFTDIFLEGINATDFTFATTCGTNGAALAPGESCASIIYYSPSFAGGESVSQIYQGNFPQQTVFIQGTSTEVVIKPTSLSFPKTVVGTTSASKSVTFTNVGPTALTIIGVNWSGSYPYFSQTDTCAGSVPPHSSCTFNLSFTPLTAGTFSANLFIEDPDPSGPQKIMVVGTGVNGSE
jgi:hypothetical protein